MIFVFVNYSTFCTTVRVIIMSDLNGLASENAPADTQPTPTQGDPTSERATDSISRNLPPYSHIDIGLSKRPRDARLLHMILANYGVTAYQERVSLQLMDFAYRYTSSTLQDALHFTSEGYGTGAGAARGTAHSDFGSITLSALRLSIASRTHYQFNPILPKDFYNEIAQDRNRVAIPPVSREWGMRLPPDQYCLTGQGWDLKESWDEDLEMDKDEDIKGGLTLKEDITENFIEGEENEGEGDIADIFGQEMNADMDDDTNDK